MTRFQYAGPAVCVAALFSGGAAYADVTAQQVWENWKLSLDMYGDGAVTIGGETASGGTLTVSDIQIAMSQPDGSFEIDFGDMVFTENGDGTVSVAIPAEIPLVFSPDDMINDNDRATLQIRPGQSDILVSGTPEEMQYEVTAQRYEIELVELFADGEAIPGEAVLALNDLAGSYTMRGTTLREIDYAVDIGSVDILVDFDVPDEATLLFSGKIEDISSEASVSVPEGIETMDPENPMAMFESGLSFAGGYSIGAMNYLLNFAEGNDSFQGTATAAGGELVASFDADAFSYNTQINGLAVSFTGSDVPFPVDVSVGQYGLGITMPLSRTDEPADFAASVNLTDVAVNEMIWSMIDPGNALPHDPATAVIDVTGTVKLLFDILDPQQAEQMAMADIPGELYSLNLDDLNVAIAGAQLTGAGSFTFDNSDMSTFPGMPRPNGEASFQLSGANALIDKLVGMGLLPEEEVMGARMMMGMFTTVTGDDQLETTVQVNDQGHLIVNGQRLQ